MRLSVIAALVGTADAATKAQAPNGVQKVIDLLESMRKTLMEEAKDDDKRFAKMECWCRQTTEEQTAIKENAEKELGETKALIDQKTGEIAKLGQENKGMSEDVAKNEKELATAKKNREKEAQAAAKAQQEITETLTALGKALEILGKLHPKNSFVDASTASSLLQVMSKASHFRDTLQKDLFDMLGQLSQGQSVTRFLQKDYSKGPVMPEGAKAAESKAYNSQSGAIFGLLSEMESQFQRDLKQSQDDEAAAIENFEKLVAAKTGENQSLKEQIAANKEAIGAAKMALSNATKDNKEAARNYKNSTEMLAEVKTTCEDATTGHQERVKARGDEITAVGEALSVLTSDDARTLFNKTSFVQLRASNMKAINAERKRAAVSTLLAVARKTGDVRLSALAVSAQLDAFTKVKEVIANLVSELTAQKKEEFAHRDRCNEDITNYESDLRTEEINKEDADAQVELMTSNIEKLTKEMEALNAATKKAQEAIASATAQRQEDSAAYQVALKDQQLTIEVLDKALAKLAPVYGASMALAQQPKQATYEKSNAGPSVMGLLETIKADSQHAIEIMTSDEQKAQSEYEKLVADLNGELENMAAQLTQKSGEKADATASKASAQEASDSAAEAMMGIDKALVVKHKECDFLLNNFQVRQDSFSAEIDACNQAIAILSGADFGF